MPEIIIELGDVVECDESTGPDERSVHLEIGLHSLVSVIAIDKKKVKFCLLKKLFDFLSRHNTV